MLGAGSSGQIQGSAKGARNIVVTAAQNAYTSTSQIVTDGVPLLRISDIIEGTGITTSTADGRGVVLDVDASGAGLVTTSTIRTVAGHPLDVTSTTVGSIPYVDIGTTGGTFNVASPLIFDGGRYSIFDDSGEVSCGDPPVPATAPSIPYTLYSPVSSQAAWCDDGGFADVSTANYPASFMDIVTTRSLYTSAGVTDTATQTWYRFGTGGMVHNAASGNTSTYGENASIAGTLTAGDSALGNVVSGGYITAVNHITAGSPSSSWLGFGTIGSVNGIFGLFEDDVHSLDAVYGNQAVVVGQGSQKVNNNGWLTLATNGTNGVPTVGYQIGNIYTSARGMEFDNVGAWNQGADSSAFWFDDAIRAAGDIATSATLRGDDVVTADDITAGDDLFVTDDGLIAHAMLGSASTAPSAGVAAQVLCPSDTAGMQLWRNSSSTGATAIIGARLSTQNVANFGAIKWTRTNSPIGGATDLIFTTFVASSDNEVARYNGAGDYITLYDMAVTGRAAFGTGTAPTSGAYVQTPSLDINASTDAGQATILNGTDSIGVSTAAVTATDVIICTWAAGNGDTGYAPYAADINAGTGFTIFVPQVTAVTGDTVVNWRIIH